MSPEALNLFAQLLSMVKLDATDPELEDKAALIGRVRAELSSALSALAVPPAPPVKPEHNGRVTKPKPKPVSA